VRFAAWRDLLYRIKTAPPRFGNAGHASYRMLSPHEHAPQLFSWRLGQQAGPG
jgi:hypothetical protein